MFWKKKEDKRGLPELPPLKPDFAYRHPPVTKPSTALPAEKNLPSFPEPMQTGFSQAVIKTAVSTEDMKEKPIPGLSPRPKTLELEEWRPQKTPEALPPPSVLPKKHDIYIKIDKFHSAKKSLESAKEKLEEIEDTLRKIRETKMREEQELSGWEKELATVKARVQDVTANIFERE